MCVVLPVDHIPCSHTIAIWQHCINAFRSFSGLKPCSRIRQHARPILTRKLCVHCGGPRYFARRGGIAARGNAHHAIAEKKEPGSPYDSGYCSDIIDEEEESYESDSTLSPRSGKFPTTEWQAVSRQSSASTRRTHSRCSSDWNPNLKEELTRRESAASTMSSFSQKSDPTCHPSQEITPMSRSSTPILRKPSPERKNSTLLHPSPPVEESTDENDCYVRDFAMGELTPTATPIAQRPPPPKRSESSLLHPSLPYNDSMSTPKISILSISSPVMTAEPTAFPFPILTETPPTPLATNVIFQRRTSVLHSALSDDEWEEPLHSSLSDDEHESEEKDVAVVAAKVGRSVERGSRISIYGRNLRILV
jgi:hypothetical protein